MISAEELNPHGYDVSDEIAANLALLLVKMNQVRTAYGKPMIVTSGLRSESDQETINPDAPHSKHLTGQAVDIADPDGELKQWVLDNLDLMAEIGFWFEDFRFCKNWVHWQIVPYGSWIEGKPRFFIP